MNPQDQLYFTREINALKAQLKHARSEDVADIQESLYEAQQDYANAQSWDEIEARGY